MRRFPLTILAFALTILPQALAMMLPVAATVRLAALTAGTCGTMVSICISNLISVPAIQMSCPEGLTGKVMSLALLCSLCAQPLGQITYGLATLMWTVPGGAQETGGSYMRDPRRPRHFTDEFKRQIVDLYNAGKPKREAMDEYGLGKSTVERWVESISAAGSPRAADNRTPGQDRILELERENRRLRMEVDVLKRAAPIYARK